MDLIARISSRGVLFKAAAVGALLAGTASGALAIHLYSRQAKTTKAQITVAHKVSESFIQSHTIQNLVNPRGHRIWEDARSIVIDAPDATDEAILATFMRGFFTGPAFAPERTALRLLGLKIFWYPRFKTANIPAWKVSELPNGLFPVGTLLWGVFMVADVRLDTEEKTVDILFNSSEGTFAGCHRLSVQRGGKGVKLGLECVVCNPSVDADPALSWTRPFHDWYAMLLFRDAAADVLQL